jgi:hypothetical protein
LRSPVGLVLHVDDVDAGTVESSATDSPMTPADMQAALNEQA